jgi:hypothetical protein
MEYPLMIESKQNAFAILGQLRMESDSEILGGGQELRRIDSDLDKLISIQCLFRNLLRFSRENRY